MRPLMVFGLLAASIVAVLNENVALCLLLVGLALALTFASYRE